jgi:hypothetical protein
MASISEGGALSMLHQPDTLFIWQISLFFELGKSAQHYGLIGV